MSEIVVLDAVSVATLARAARDRAAAESDQAIVGALVRYADELDDITESAVTLDQHEHEIEHQLRWWDDRVRALQSDLTGHPGDDVEIVRALALYRGRISGAHTMRRHYAQQRNALLARQTTADTACADAIAAP
ncbi:hypothetical protein BH09ACT4_BH09ACT4_13070 [soil metagenome]